FLAPDAIPEKIITAGSRHLGSLLQSIAHDPMALNKAIAALGSYSLIRRDQKMSTLSIHRLVQAVLIDSMGKKEQKVWTKRLIKAVLKAFPDSSPVTWAECQQYLPHAQACATLIDQFAIMSKEAVRLLSRMASYLNDRGLNNQEEPFLQQALQIEMKLFGSEDLRVTSRLDELAMSRLEQGKYREAEPLFQKVLASREKCLGPEHPDVAHT